MKLCTCVRLIKLNNTYTDILIVHVFLCLKQKDFYLFRQLRGDEDWKMASDVSCTITYFFVSEIKKDTNININRIYKSDIIYSMPFSTIYAQDIVVG